MGKNSRRLHDSRAAARRFCFTLGLLAIYRVGWWIPLPIIDQQPDGRRSSSAAAGLGQLFQQVAMFSAAQLNQVTIFGLGIMPYISASIIFQLLGSVWEPLEAVAERRRKRPQENQRIHPLCHGRASASAKAGSTWRS